MNQKNLNNILTAIAGILIFLAIYFNFYNSFFIFSGLGLITIFLIYNKFFKKRINPEIGNQVKNVIKTSSLLLSIFYLILSSYVFIVVGFCGSCQEIIILLCIASVLVATPMILIGTILFCNAMNKNIWFKIFSGILLIDFVFIEILLLPICFNFLNNNTEKVSMDWLLFPGIIATLISIIILIRKLIKKNDQVDQVTIDEPDSELNKTKKNRKNSTLTLIIIIIAILSWATFNIFFPNIPNHPYATTQEEINALNDCYRADKTVRPICIAKVATDYKNENTCEEIPSYSSWKNGCYKDVAFAKKDPELCKKISEEWMRDECYKNLAVSMNDAHLCKDSGSLKKVCFKDVGIEQELIKKAVEQNLYTLVEELKISFPEIKFISYYYNQEKSGIDDSIGVITGYSKKAIYLDAVIEELNKKEGGAFRKAFCENCVIKKITNPNDPLGFEIEILFWKRDFNLEEYL
jgi:hypothetical protein